MGEGSGVVHTSSRVMSGAIVEPREWWRCRIGCAYLPRYTDTPHGTLARSAIIVERMANPSQFTILQKDGLDHA